MSKTFFYNASGLTEDLGVGFFYRSASWLLQKIFILIHSLGLLFNVHYHSKVGVFFFIITITYF